MEFSQTLKSCYILLNIVTASNFFAQDNLFSNFLEHDVVKNYIACAEKMPTDSQWEKASSEQKENFSQLFDECQSFFFWDPRFPNHTWLQRNLQERARVTLYMRALEFLPKNNSRLHVEQASYFSNRVVNMLWSIKIQRGRI